VCQGSAEPAHASSSAPSKHGAAGDCFGEIIADTGSENRGYHGIAPCIGREFLVMKIPWKNGDFLQYFQTPDVSLFPKNHRLGGIFHVVLYNRFPVLYPAVVEAVSSDDLLTCSRLLDQNPLLHCSSNTILDII